MLLITGFKEMTTILVNAYYASQLSQRLESSIVPATAIGAFEKRLDQMEVNVQNISDKILHISTPLSPALANNDVL